jgi:hypothetical protein
MAGRKVLFAFIVLSLTLFQTSKSQLWAQGCDREVAARLNELKTTLEAQLVGLRDQRQIAALALRDSAKAWFISAHCLRNNFSPMELEERLASLERQWLKNKNSWDNLERLSLQFYFESLVNLSVSLAYHADDRRGFEEMTWLLTRAEPGYGRAKTASAKTAEAKVRWSNRISAIAASLVKVKAVEQNQALEDLVADMVNRAAVVANRDDIHYLGRMNLLYLNNAQGLTSILFLLAKSEGSPFIEQAGDMEKAWREHMDQKDSQVADLVSLTWVTNAQITFPLAFWLASETKENKFGKSKEEDKASSSSPSWPKGDGAKPPEAPEP